LRCCVAALLSRSWHMSYISCADPVSGAFRGDSPSEKALRLEPAAVRTWGLGATETAVCFCCAHRALTTYHQGPPGGRTMFARWLLAYPPLHVLGVSQQLLMLVTQAMLTRSYLQHSFPAPVPRTLCSWRRVPRWEVASARSVGTGGSGGGVFVGDEARDGAMHGTREENVIEVVVPISAASAHCVANERRGRAKGWSMRRE
jgi:hypothetical protein